MKRIIAFRVDWSTQLGHGHLQRCLSLGEALAARNVGSVFLANRQPAGVGPGAAGFEIAWLSHPRSIEQRIQLNRTGEQQDESDSMQLDDANLSVGAMREIGADAVVVDRYGLDRVWESLVSDELGIPVVAIDGLADRRHTADLVIDPTYVADDRTRWLGRVEPSTRVLRGPRYALIPPQFQEQLRRRPSRNGTVHRVLISFGGSDPQDLTHRALDAFEMLTDLDLSLDVVVGAGHADPRPVRARCDELPNTSFHHATTRMAELMTAADLAVGSGGITTYERAYLGLPAIVIVAADNQDAQARSIARAGAALVLGKVESVTATQLASAVRSIAADTATLRQMSVAARAIVQNDTVPGSNHVADEVIKLLQLHP